LKAIQGTSQFNPKILNDLIQQTAEKLDIAQDEVTRHEIELQNKQNHITTIQSQYHSMVSWADMFENADIETKKMIVGYLIECVRVGRGYEIDIRFNVGYEHFVQSELMKGDDVFA